MFTLWKVVQSLQQEEEKLGYIIHNSKFSTNVVILLHNGLYKYEYMYKTKILIL